MASTIGVLSSILRIEAEVRAIDPRKTSNAWCSEVYPVLPDWEV